MREAKETLEKPSADPQTRLAAQARDMHLAAYYDTLAAEREAGEARGRVEGKAGMLLRQIGKRYGAPSQDVIDRVQKASSDQVESWADRILDAQSFDELLTDA